jgi:hypothetical protein
MDIEDLRRNLMYLAEKYVSDDNLKREMYALIQRDGTPPVKAVMSMLVTNAKIDPSDAALIKTIAFHYL